MTVKHIGDTVNILAVMIYLSIYLSIYLYLFESSITSHTVIGSSKKKFKQDTDGKTITVKRVTVRIKLIL